ncbi:MAG TPA: hypothetical protein VEU62_15215, partial [Bryobacterales bacterium]|nr:hypothetical protein [Bryobacterales bacterium]
HLRVSSDVVALYYTNYLGYQQYNVPWRDLSLFVENNLYFLLTGISKLFVYDTGGGFWAGWFWRLFAFASIAGVVRLARKSGAMLSQISPYHWFAAGFVPLLILWHFPPDERLTLPVYPLLLAGLAVELGHVIEMLREAFERSPLAGKAFAGLLAAGIAAFVYLAAYFSFVGLFQFLPGIVEQHRSLLASERRAYRWISQNTPPDAAFLSYDDPILYLYSGRRGCSVPVPPRVFYHEGTTGVFRLFENLEGFARQHHLQGMLVTVADFYRGEISSEQREALQRGVAKNPAFRPVYGSSMSWVYLIEPQLTPPRQPPL